MPPIKTTRRAIYDLVWSMPMSKVAQEFSISDVALKKICQKHRVPSPPRGYWAKKEAGKPVKQPRFAETDDPQDELVTIYGSNQADLPAPVREVLERAKASRSAQQLSPPVDSQTAPVPIEQIHSVVFATAHKLRKQKPNKDGVASALDDHCCGVEVGSASVERAISILDVLAHSLEAQDLTIAAVGDGMTVTTGGETVKFHLKEHVQREKHAPTSEELATEERRRKRHGTTWDFLYERAYPEWDQVRTGRLFIEIDNQYVKSLRRTWKDGKHQRLEDLIGEITAGLTAYAVAIRLQNEERRRWRRNYERQQRRSERARFRGEREEQRRKILDELVAISVEASKLRGWLEEAKHWLEQSQPDEFTRFVDWARRRLEYLEHAIDPAGIAESLTERQLFPQPDPLLDPPEDLVQD
jgi:hypothetical protein